jgi:hypothetical protein
MATTVYNRALLLLASGALNWESADIRVLLVTSSYTPDPDSDFVDSVTGEVSATNYVRKALASKTATLDDASDRVVLDAADVVWTALGTSTPTRAVLFKQITNDADSPLIACVDISPTLAANGTDYTLVWSASGIIRLAQG